MAVNHYLAGLRRTRYFHLRQVRTPTKDTKCKYAICFIALTLIVILMVKMIKVRSSLKAVEIIIARHDEDLEWTKQLREILPHARITVYNKGADNIVKEWNIEVIPRPDQGREGETFAWHMADQYDDLAEMNIFLQGWPFQHAPYLFESLRNLSMTNDYQGLSLRYSEDLPPPKLVARRCNKYVREQAFRTDTLSALDFDDVGLRDFLAAHMAANNITQPTNVIHHFITSLDLPDEVFPDSTTSATFSIGGQFAVSARNIRQYPRKTYTNIVGKLLNCKETGWVLERTWGPLFNKAGHNASQEVCLEPIL